MKLKLSDYIFIAALILFIVSHVATNFLIKYYEDAAEAVGVAKEVALQYETNPVARKLLGMEDFRRMYSFVIMPGVLSGMYWLIRRKYNKDPIAIEAYAIAFFMFGLLTASNDLSIVAGLLA